MCILSMLHAGFYFFNLILSIFYLFWSKSTGLERFSTVHKFTQLISGGQNLNPSLSNPETQALNRCVLPSTNIEECLLVL